MAQGASPDSARYACSTFCKLKKKGLSDRTSCCKSELFKVGSIPTEGSTSFNSKLSFHGLRSAQAGTGSHSEGERQITGGKRNDMGEV